MSSGALVPYSKATEIAATFESCTTSIKRLIGELGEEFTRLENAFRFEGATYGAFDVGLTYQYSKTARFTADGMAKLHDHFTRAAWKILIEKLGVEKLMSPRDRDKLRDQISGERGNDGKVAAPLPEISAESIIQVLTGFIADAPRFIEQSIREVYEWLIPRGSRGAGKYVTNHKDRLGRKVIIGYVADLWDHRINGVNCRMYSQITALDAVFHSIDGAGIPDGHHGPLLSAMIESREFNWQGETGYFRFRLHKNGNAHIEFRRPDLVDLFNQVAADGKSLGVAKGHDQ